MNPDITAESRQLHYKNVDHIAVTLLIMHLWNFPWMRYTDPQIISLQST